MMSLVYRKHLHKIWFLIVLCVGMVGCGSANKNEPRLATNKPKVVATSTIIEDLTEEIAGEEIELIGILKPGSDPHIYEPVPTDTIALEKAQLIFYNGYNLEPALIKLMSTTGARAKKIAVGEVVKPLQLEKKGQKVPDPHVWMDAKNVIKMVALMRDELSKISPEDEVKFTENAKILTAKLEKLDIWITKQIGTIPAQNRRLVTTHDAFQYYAKAYKIEVLGTLIGMSTEEQPSVETMRNLITSIKKTGTPALFAETTIKSTLIQTVAQEAGVKLADKPLYSDSIGKQGTDADSYIKMMVANTRTIVDALGGKSEPFVP